MKISKKIAIPLGFVSLAIIALVGLEVSHTTHVFQSKASQQKQQSTTYDNSRKKTLIESTDVTSDNTTTSTAPSVYTPPTNSDNIILSGTQTQDGSVTIISKLAGYSDGTCTLTITNGSVTRVKTADIVYQTEYSMCAGFSIPVGELGTGNWQLSLSVLSGGVTTTKAISLLVK